MNEHHTRPPEYCRDCEREYDVDELSPSGYCQDCYPNIQGHRIEHGLGQPAKAVRRTTPRQERNVSPGREQLREMLADYRARKNNNTPKGTNE